METLIEFLKANKPGAFRPEPDYSAEGDSLTFFFEDHEYYGERIDSFLTAYRAVDSDDLVGCQIKGLPKALELLGDFGIAISDGNVLLTMVFMALMAQTPEREAVECYRELGRLAARSKPEIRVPRQQLSPA